MAIPRTAALLAALLGALALASIAGAAPVGVYRNAMSTDAQRGQIVKFSGERCSRGGSEGALRIFVGKQTSECTYRTPVFGRDLEIAATARLLSGTPPQIRNKSYLALNLRAGMAGAHYQLAVFPMQGKVQLRKVHPEGQVEFLHIQKDVKSIEGLNGANNLRLRAFNITSGPEQGKCKILAFVGRELVADVTDGAAGELQGRTSGLGIGAPGNAKGLLGSFDNVVVRVPNPFE